MIISYSKMNKYLPKKTELLKKVRENLKSIWLAFSVRFKRIEVINTKATYKKKKKRERESMWLQELLEVESMTEECTNSVTI